ncbi:MAG TPA: hypothetical protein VGP68_20190, partial [Gemmataceae bacterium]|nr:hypothetical protein [Gemmataceae bacterium]
KRATLPPNSSGQPEKKPGSVTMDALRLPARAVLVLYDEAKDALQLLPRLIVMTPEEYQRIQDQLEQLRRQVRAEKPEAPSVCKLKGRVDGDLVRLEAHFEFHTEGPKATVRLGCQKAWPISAKVDGKTPWLRQTDDGLVLIVETPGKHVATIELLAPLVSRRGPRGPERGLDLDLPRAAITKIERLELPAGVAEVRLGSRQLKPRRLENRAELLESVLVGPGPVDHLDLTWQAPRNAGVMIAAPVFAVGEHIIVRVHDAEILTEAEITLRVLRGEMSKWRLRMPAPGATVVELKPAAQEEDRVSAIEKQLDGNFVNWDVSSKDPTSETLRLSLQVRQPRPRLPLGIGPIGVAGATTQRGEIEIRAAEDLRLTLQESPELNRRELTEEQRRDKVRAAYVFGSLVDASAAAAPLVSVQVEDVKGVVEAKTLQSLRFLENEKNKSPAWQLVTRVEITPLRTGVDRLEFTLPAGYEYDGSVGPMPAELVEEVTPDPAAQRLAIKLAQKQTKPFAFSITGIYPLADDRIPKASLELPRPLTWDDERQGPGQRLPVLDRGGEVTVQIPEAFELFDPANGRGLDPRSAKGLGSSLLFAPRAVRPTTAGMREYTWISERLPKSIDLNWRPYRPEMPVDATVDVSLSAGRARVRERLQFQFLQPPPPQVPLKVRRGFELEAVEGGRFVGETDANGERDLILQTPVGKIHTVTLEYLVPLPPADAAGRTVLIPVFQAQTATRGRTRVRVWCDADLSVSSSSKEWSVGLPEIAADRESLPVLVLNGGLADAAPLYLESSPHSAAAVLVDRVLVCATIGDDGTQSYRTRFVLQRLADHRLELEFPVLLGRGNVVVTLGGKRLPLTFLDASGKPAEIGKTARLAVEPELYRQPVILDVRFDVDRERLEEPSRWQIRLQPVILHNAIMLGRVRWQVEAAGDLIPLLAREGYTREQRWGWRGWLWGPRPAATAADLEQWLQGSLTAPASDANEPSFVCWKSSLGEMRLLLIPNRFWLLLCSLAALMLFVVLAIVPMPGYLYGTVVAVVTALLGAVGLFWPDLLGLAAFGCEPALVVLCILLGVRWRLHHQYRQRMVFMPGFTQLKNGSSLTKKDSSKIRRDLPTVEAQSPKSAPVGPESQP